MAKDGTHGTQHTQEHKHHSHTCILPAAAIQDVVPRNAQLPTQRVGLRRLRLSDKQFLTLLAHELHLSKGAGEGGGGEDTFTTLARTGGATFVLRTHQYTTATP